MTDALMILAIMTLVLAGWAWGKWLSKEIDKEDGE